MVKACLIECIIEVRKVGYVLREYDNRFRWMKRRLSKKEGMFRDQRLTGFVLVLSREQVDEYAIWE